ncbi:MAG: Hsp20 family protein [candidate division Zixibacteria bacterium]|nr:Hsp20 family protein [candidate division Zixibacteria bacterium]
MSIGDFKKDLMQDMRQMQEEMDLLFNQLSHWRHSPTTNRLWRPPTDVWETDSEVVVLIEMAGIKLSDITLTLKENILTVKGARALRFAKEDCCFRNMEISRGRFERNIFLPETIDAEQVKAKYRDGFLEITVPKMEHHTGSAREITISEE